MTASQRRLKGIAGQMKKQNIPLPIDAQLVRRAWRLYRTFQAGTCPPLRNGDDFCEVSLVLVDAATELRERDYLAPADIDGAALFAFCEVFGQILGDLLRSDVKGEQCLQERQERVRTGQASDAELTAVVAWQLLFAWQDEFFGEEDTPEDAEGTNAMAS